MAKLVRRIDSTPLSPWLQSIGVLREDGRPTLPILDRCPTCRSTPGCGTCPACLNGGVCHRLPPCPNCGVVQLREVERLVRHPLHREIYGETPEAEVLQTSNGVLFVHSVAALGIIEPVLALEAEHDDETGARSGDLLILSGWRRVLAARACGMSMVPVRLVDPRALPRRADVDLVIVSANLQRQKTLEEIRREVHVWKRAVAHASVRQPKPWELRMIVAQVLGVSVRTIQQAEMLTARQRLREAVESARNVRSPSIPTDDELSIVSRLRQEQQPGDLRGVDIISALTEHDEPLLSAERDEVVHESIERAAQTAEGTFILDVDAPAPLWPGDTSEVTMSPNGEADPDHLQCFHAAVPRDDGSPDVDPAAKRTGEAHLSGDESVGTEPVRVGNLVIHRGPADALPFDDLPAVDLIVAAPSWFEPLVRPLVAPTHVAFVPDWQPRLRGCLEAWRRAIRPGGRLLLIVPVSTPLHPGLPLLHAAIDELRSTDWAIGGTLVLDDPGLHGPSYAVPHVDQLPPPSGPARLIIAAAPVLPNAEGSLEEKWRNSWAAPLPGVRPREVATVEEAALGHLWKYAGPGRRSRWLPEFHPGLLYHLVRIFSRPDGTVFLPELGGTNMVRGCLRTGRQVVALAEIPEQVAEVVNRISRDPGLTQVTRGTTFSSDSLVAVTKDVGQDYVGGKG